MGKMSPLVVLNFPLRQEASCLQIHKGSYKVKSPGRLTPRGGGRSDVEGLPPGVSDLVRYTSPPPSSGSSQSTERSLFQRNKRSDEGRDPLR